MLLVCCAQQFFTMYHNNAPMIPFLFDDLERMYRNLLELIVDSSVLMKCNAGEIVLIYILKGALVVCMSIRPSITQN